MNFMVGEARKRGVEIVRARYVPTARNGMVRDFFGKMGFRFARQSADGVIDWEVETSAYQPGIHFIEVDAGDAPHAAR